MDSPAFRRCKIGDTRVDLRAIPEVHTFVPSVYNQRLTEALNS